MSQPSMTSEACVDAIAYQLKAKGIKYYDRIALSCYTDEPIVIDPQDVDASIISPLRTPKEIDQVISNALMRIFDIVHRRWCTESHRLIWQYGDMKGQITTPEVKPKVHIQKGTIVRRFEP